jgi:hypothetical protein
LAVSRIFHFVSCGLSKMPMIVVTEGNSCSLRASRKVVVRVPSPSLFGTVWHGLPSKEYQ